MKTTSIGSGLLVIAFFSLSIASALSETGRVNSASFDKYRMILERAPFGQLPKTPSAEELAAALAQAAQTQPTEEVPRLSDTISLNAMSRFRGVPAAGFLDNQSGRSFFLTEGQTLGDFTLEAVSFETSSVMLTKGNQTEPISLSYASGQATNLTLNADANYLSVLNVRTPDGLTPKDTLPETEVIADTVDRNLAEKKNALPAFTPEAIAAATIIDDNGEAHLSFRELHRLRVQQSKEKAEQERREIEARANVERERATAKAKEEAEQAEITAKFQVAAENLHRRQIIQAIKAGEVVEVDFELTAKEAAELAAAGFEISAEEIKSAESKDLVTQPDNEPAQRP